jgi:hypothetical protein
LLRPHTFVAVEGVVVVDHPASLLIAWRERAAHLQQFGDPNAARLWQLAAVELEQALKALGEETLTLVEAAALSGYSADHLGWLLKKGKLRNYGRRHAPRLRRGDLPIKSPAKPGRPPHQQRAAASGRATDVTKLVRRRP